MIEPKVTISLEEYNQLKETERVMKENTPVYGFETVITSFTPYTHELNIIFKNENDAIKEIREYYEDELSRLKDLMDSYIKEEKEIIKQEQKSFIMNIFSKFRRIV